MEVTTDSVFVMVTLSSWMVENGDFKLVNDVSLAKLKTQWKIATACFSEVSTETIESWWTHIQELHCRMERAYHTLVHLEELFGYLEILEIDSKHPDFHALALSIFFHDAIYDAKSGTNEEDSATLFREFCSDVGDCRQKILELKVVDYILATKHHDTNQTDDKTLAMFLDIDMAVLGKNPPAYEAYARLIRQEYNHVNHLIYCEKRAQVLQTFLESPTIFFTPLLRTALEETARKNLRDEIEMLKQGIIPGESIE